MHVSPFIPGLVSVILPVFNRPEFLSQAVAQVLAQTYRPLEIILVDDGSTDGTGVLCDDLKARHPEIARVVHRENGGPGAARESGRLLAGGEFIQYFDSDDQIDPRKFEVQMKALRANPDCGVAYCKTRELTRGDPHDGRCSHYTGEKMDRLFPRLLASRCWQTVTPLIRRDLSDAVGPWLPLRQEEDWEYDSRIAALGAKLFYCEHYLASFVHHPGIRASGELLGEKIKLRDRCTARLLILERALRAGVDDKCPDRQFFAQSLFLLSRQCGAAGLAAESRQMFGASRIAAGQMKLKHQAIYGLLAALVGWRNAGALCGRIDNFRQRT